MPTSRILFHRLAAHEYRLARNWYQDRSAEVAQRFVAAVDRAVNRIATDADSLPLLIGAYRYARAARFPYVLVCRRLEADVIMVIAVAHTSRRPAYWHRRSGR